MKQRWSGLTKSLFQLSVLPLLAFGLVVLIISSLVIYTSIEKEVKESLLAQNKTACQILDLTYPGNFLADDNGVVYKGDAVISGKHELVDQLCQATRMDVTLFYGDQRLLTSIRDASGERAVGTVAALEVVQAVLEEGEPYFSDRVLVNGVPYFGSYMPVADADGIIVGMIFAGKPRMTVMHAIYKNLLGIFIVVVIALVVTGSFSAAFSGRIIMALNRIKEFLGSIATGDLKAELDQALLERSDEIGEMGRFAVMLQNSITELVGTDPLTGLYNRRSCEVILQEVYHNYKRRGARFVLVLADIDWFKTVNDRFGHQAGDEVLRRVSDVLKSHMEHKGFVFRWGGEEFLFIYEGTTLETVLEDIDQLKQKINGIELCHEGSCFRVTMTFGVADCADQANMEKLIRQADDHLYRGKELGKNMVVYQEDK